MPNAHTASELVRGGSRSLQVGAFGVVGLALLAVALPSTAVAERLQMSTTLESRPRASRTLAFRTLASKRIWYARKFGALCDGVLSPTGTGSGSVDGTAIQSR